MSPYDIWFARKRHTSGQDRGAEIMLWLRSKGLGRPSGHCLLNRSWWLTAVEAGFEVWRGGAGPRTTSFWVHL